MATLFIAQAIADLRCLSASRMAVPPLPVDNKPAPSRFYGVVLNVSPGGGTTMALRKGGD